MLRVVELAFLPLGRLGHPYRDDTALEGSSFYGASRQSPKEPPAVVMITAPVLSLLGSPTDDALSWVTHAVRDTIPGVAFASITLTSRDGHLATVGSTDPLATRSDTAQYELLEGPCIDASFGARLAHSGDVRFDPRWRRYAGRVDELGIRTHAGLAIYSGSRTLGGLNLYSTRPCSLDDASLDFARRFADQAGAALELTRSVAAGTDAVLARETITQAIGIVMERFQLSAARAFQYLVRVSQTSNVKLRVVARELVQQVNPVDIDAPRAVTGRWTVPLS